MRAISWNIGKNFKIIEQQLKIVDEEKPDILALQEVTNKSYKIINEISVANLCIAESIKSSTTPQGKTKSLNSWKANVRP